MNATLVGLNGRKIEPALGRRVVANEARVEGEDGQRLIVAVAHQEERRLGARGQGDGGWVDDNRAAALGVLDIDKAGDLEVIGVGRNQPIGCLLYTSPSPRD